MIRDVIYLLTYCYRILECKSCSHINLIIFYVLYDDKKAVMGVSRSFETKVVPVKFIRFCKNEHKFDLKLN